MIHPFGFVICFFFLRYFVSLLEICVGDSWGRGHVKFALPFLQQDIFTPNSWHCFLEIESFGRSLQLPKPRRFGRRSDRENSVQPAGTVSLFAVPTDNHGTYSSFHSFSPIRCRESLGWRDFVLEIVPISFCRLLYFFFSCC